MSFDLVNLREPVNRSHPLNRGRIGWWLSLPTNGGGPKWWDLCGLYHATATGTVPSTLWQSGPRGSQYASLSGASGFKAALSPNTYFAPSAAGISAAAWVFPSNSNYIDSHWFKYDNSWGFRVHAGMAPAIYMFDSGGTLHQPIATASLTQNQWSRVGFSWDRSNVTFYINGVPAGTSALSIATSTSTNNNLGVGSNYSGGEGWVGGIDDASIWNRPLTAAEWEQDLNLSMKKYPAVINNQSLLLNYKKQSKCLINIFNQRSI